MSYKALYRTYRPRSFDQVIGQDHVINTLRNSIKQNKVGHAYLFTGPRGTGKTSVAHIFANELNRSASGELVADELDIVEIDAASNNGVAEVRVLIENSRYAPTKARFKVYIIDEVHMLTKGAFNALLKTLEEPPQHVIFILATTEPHKLPVTILSRCQRFNFKRIEEEIIADQLVTILKKENIEFEQSAINFIARLAEGSMRDALSVAEQAAAFSNNFITFLALSQVFGLVSIETQTRLLNLAFSGEIKELMRTIYDLIDNGADVERTATSLVRILKDYIVYRKTKDISLVDYVTKSDLESLSLTISFAYAAIDILMSTINSLRFSEFPIQVFELAILKISQTRETSSPDISEAKVATEPRREAATKISHTAEIEKKASVMAAQKIQDRVAHSEELFNVKSGPTGVASSDKKHATSELATPKSKEATKVVAVDPEKLAITKPITSNTKTRSIKMDLSEIAIVNALSISTKEALQKAKDNWMKILRVSSEARFTRFANTLIATKLISAGENFIIVGSEDETVVGDIRDEFESQAFLEFTNAVFGTPHYIFALSKDEFESAKKTFTSLKATNKLPPSHPILAPVLKPRSKTGAEEYGEDLFGEVLNFKR